MFLFFVIDEFPTLPVTFRAPENATLFGGRFKILKKIKNTVANDHKKW